MKTLSIRAAVLAALSCSVVAQGHPPATIKATEYPLSCTAAAKPLVQKGWDAATNMRSDQAREAFKQAVATDPKCAVAQAMLAMHTPGVDGKKLFEQAIAKLSELTEVERLDLQAIEASRAGNPEKALAIAQRARDLAPGVFLLNLAVAEYAARLNDWGNVDLAARQATELNPKSGAGWNLVGYAALNQHRNVEAVMAFRRYAEVAPTEPNAHDSLADALLANNQLDEALAEYQSALDTSKGQFVWSWDGIATVKALKGDYDGARAALTKQRDAITDK